MSRSVITLVLGLLASGGVVHAAGTEVAAFDELKQLVGTWQPADKPESALRVDFALIANGSVLTENWNAPGHASMTVYHLDGDRLLATHYCPRGNQPRMALAGRGEDGTLRFEFVDGTGLDEAGEWYEHLLTLRLDEAGGLVRGEIYKAIGEPTDELGEPEETRFARVPL